MGWKHYQTVDPRKREPLVARGLFGIRLLIKAFKAGVNVKAVLRLLNTAFLPISQLRFKRH